MIFPFMVDQTYHIMIFLGKKKYFLYNTKRVRLLFSFEPLTYKENDEIRLEEVD